MAYKIEEVSKKSNALNLLQNVKNMQHIEQYKLFINILLACNHLN